MNESISVPERLIVAADFSPKGIGRDAVLERVLSLADELNGLGVVFKVNSALRALGYGLITDLHARGVRVCADLKLVDIPHTLQFDGEFLSETQPDFVTVMCNAEIDGMIALRKTLHPDTKLLGVTVLTTLKEDIAQQAFRAPIKTMVLEYARNAKLAGLWGLVASAEEGTLVQGRQELVGLNLCTPGIRYPWSEDKLDDQVRTASAGFAVTHGVTCVIVGRPILNAKASDDPNKPQSRRQATEWILKDIVDSLAEKAKTEQQKGEVTK